MLAFSQSTHCLVSTAIGRGRSVTFDRPLFLAPMEGITDPIFRKLIVDIGGLGAVVSEFIRIGQHVLPEKRLREHLGPPLSVPQGLQLMASEAQYVAETAQNGEAAGADFIDLNFGCPVKRVFNKCAGSALLAFPQELHAICKSAVRAVSCPVGAKIRAGIEDASLLTDNIQALLDAGVAIITVHARLRKNTYAEPAQWQWLQQVREQLDNSSHKNVLFWGNGGLDEIEDVETMLSRCGCDGAMVGRALLRNPYFFRDLVNGKRASREELRSFALKYLSALEIERGAALALGRTKQLIKYCEHGFDDKERSIILRLQSCDELRSQLS